MAALKAFAITLILTPILRDVFRTYGVVDRPGFRRIHRHPIPRIGGISLAIAYAFGMYSLGTSDPALGAVALRLLPGAAVVFLPGLLDDFFSLRPLVKLGAQIIAALLVFFSGLNIGTLSAGALPLWLNLPLTVFWLLLTTNALNLIDGLDGLCTGIGLLATLTLFGAALLNGFLLGCYGMIWTQKTSTLLSLLVPLIALSVPLLDASVAVVRRTLRRQPI